MSINIKFATPGNYKIGYSELQLVQMEKFLNSFDAEYKAYKNVLYYEHFTLCLDPASSL